MNRTDIRRFLNYPDIGLVAHALKRANLNRRELQTIGLREWSCLTIEQAAEKLDRSVGTVKNDYSAGMDKLDQCWDGLTWIDTILKQ